MLIEGIMVPKDQHYFTPYPDVRLKIHTVSESLRRHLYIFKTVTDVFSFNKIDLGTKILIEHMYIPLKACDLLDLGCGYGPIGIVVAHESPKSQVHLIDINKNACWCAKENIRINISNYKGRVKVVSGNFFEPFSLKNIEFDGIFMNPPIRLGRKAFFKVCDDIYKNLKPGGSFQFVLRKKMGAEHVYHTLKERFPGEHIEITCKRSGYWVFRCFHER